MGFDDLVPDLAAKLGPRVERLGYLGEFFQVGANQPAMLSAFIDFTEAGKDSLPANLVELVAITMASLAGNDYERNQHERLAVALGLAPEWVESVEALDPSGLHDADEGAAQAYLIAAFPAQGRGAAAELDALVARIGASRAVAVMLVAGRYLVHALVVNSVGIRPPVASIFGDEGAAKSGAGDG